MSGHSKWSNIKRKKEAEDAKKGKLFTKLVKDIIVAARDGESDPATNPTLRSAIERARAESLPKSNIERAIAKGSGSGGGGAVEVTYEGYGPGGVGFLVKCLTDNTNRTVSEVRSVFNHLGGSLAEAGAVSYIFTGNPPSPSFTIPLSSEDASKIRKIQENLEEIEDVVNIFHNGLI